MTAAILDVRPAAPPGTVPAQVAATDLVRLFALDRLPVRRRRLACHWRRDADGRLACTWERDIALVPQR
jgi:hypothetical protein